MIRVTCETFEWGWFVDVTVVRGLRETKFVRANFSKDHVFVQSPADAMRAVLRDCNQLRDLPEPPEPS